VFRTRAPLSKIRRSSTARLACVRPPASVHPEPGSNSPLYVFPDPLKVFFYALVFSYLVVYCMSMIFFLSAIYKEAFLSFCSLFAVAKVIIYF
jgi:hypothetical protein